MYVQKAQGTHQATAAAAPAAPAATLLAIALARTQVLLKNVLLPQDA
jgi:hypothetical protein